MPLLEINSFDLTFSAGKTWRAVCQVTSRQKAPIMRRCFRNVSSRSHVHLLLWIHPVPFLPSDKDTMYSIMEKVMEERRQNPPTSEEEKLFVDALMELDIADEVKKADMVTFLIGGFHNTGLCKIFTHALCFLCNSWHVSAVPFLLLPFSNFLNSRHSRQN